MSRPSQAGSWTRRSSVWTLWILHRVFRSWFLFMRKRDLSWSSSCIWKDGSSGQVCRFEVLVDPARTNTAESVCAQLETDGARIVTTAAEAHNQLGKVEKHGHLFETILVKMLDQVQPKNQEEYEQCVVQTMNAKNELLNNKGMSPCQLVFGRNPRVPADLVQESPCPIAGTSPLHDANAARAHEIRTQARIALVQSQDDISLRTALAARPRAERDFLGRRLCVILEISEVWTGGSNGRGSLVWYCNCHGEDW